MDKMLGSLELSTLLISVIAGIFFGIPTGPARFFVVDTCVKDGKIAALKVYGGLTIAIVLYASLALMANELISDHKKVESIIYLAASLLLMIWGIIIIMKSNKDGNASIQLHMGTLFKKGFVVAISNPAIPFIYLTFVQVIKAYTKSASTFNYIINILILEMMSFITLAVVATILFNKRGKVLHHWRKVKLLMGIIIFCIGTYQLFQHVELSNGIKIKSSQNVLEKQVDTTEKKH